MYIYIYIYTCVTPDIPIFSRPLRTAFAQDRLFLTSMQCRQLVGVFGDSECRMAVPAAQGTGNIGERGTGKDSGKTIGKP